MKALMGRYPNAVLQFEDFNMEHATPLLDRYRDHHLCFNDDIQACTASLFSAERVEVVSGHCERRNPPRKMLTCRAAVQPA